MERESELYGMAGKEENGRTECEPNTKGIAINVMNVQGELLAGVLNASMNYYRVSSLFV